MLDPRIDIIHCPSFEQVNVIKNILKYIVSVVLKLSFIALPLIVANEIFHYVIKKYIIDDIPLFKNFYNDFCQKDGIYYDENGSKKDFCDYVNLKIYIDEKFQDFYYFTGSFLDFNE